MLKSRVEGHDLSPIEGATSGVLLTERWIPAFAGMTRKKPLHTWGRDFVAFSVLSFCFLAHPLTICAEPPSGVQPLHQLHKSDVHSLIQDGSIRPLLTAQEQEAFLKELEKEPPAWDRMHDPPGEEHGARLFDLNRRRDDLREDHPLLTQRIAFLWGAVLGAYQPDHKGFNLSIGPEHTQTSWGLVRFKPMGLPHEMIAIPSPDFLSGLQERMAAGEKITVGILFTGRLITNESIIYGFSHDGLEQGMIMPVVEVEGVEYFLPETKKASLLDAFYGLPLFPSRGVPQPACSILGYLRGNRFTLLKGWIVRC